MPHSSEPRVATELKFCMWTQGTLRVFWYQNKQIYTTLKVNPAHAKSSSHSFLAFLGVMHPLSCSYSRLYGIESNFPTKKLVEAEAFLLVEDRPFFSFFFVWPSLEKKTNNNKTSRSSWRDLQNVGTEAIVEKDWGNSCSVISVVTHPVALALASLLWSYGGMFWCVKNIDIGPRDLR